MASAAVDAAKSAYIACTDVQLPEDGKAYKIANYSLYGSGTTRFMKYTAGTALFVSNSTTAVTEDDASVFVCKELSSGVYAFITEDGKVLTWMGNGEGYLEGGSRLGYSSNYGTEYESCSDWNNITIKKNGTAEADLGYLRMVARRNSSKNSSFVVAGSTGDWNKAGDEYFFGTSGDYFSTAWVFVEADHTHNEAQALALAKIEAKFAAGNNAAKLGAELGYYSYTIGGEKVVAVAAVKTAIDAATTVSEVEAISGSYGVNIPERGKCYRIKGYVSGNYIDAVNCYSGAQMGMKAEAEYSQLGTIFYLDAEGRLLNVGTETYVKNTREIGADKANANTWTFAASARTLGCLTLTSNSGSKELHDSDGNRADRCSSICGARHDFVLEEVTIENNDDDEEVLALTKLEAKFTVENNAANLSTAVGYYSYTINEVKSADVAAIKSAIAAAATAADVETILGTYSVNLPEAGKMYRFGYDFGNGMVYMQSKNSSVRGLAMTADTDGKSVFLVENVEGNLRLKSVWSNMYLNETTSTRGLSATGADVTFSAGAALGQIKVQASSYLHANSSGTNYFVDHCSTDGSHAAHNFFAVEVVEDVVSPIPQNGKTYYIYSDTYHDGAFVNRFLYADGNNLKMNTSLQVDESYQWTCTVNGDGTMYFLNGDGKYMGYKTMSADAYAYTVANTNVHNENAVTLYANADSRYIVVHNDGSQFNHSTATYNQETQAFCTDFVFVEVDKVKLLTVNAPAVVEAEGTWNGVTKALPATWTHIEGSAISSPTLTVNYNSTNYTYNGLTEGENSLGESVEIATLEADRTITAGFTPKFFSASTNAEDLVPVRVYNVRNSNYTLRLNAAADYTNHAVNSGTTVYGENEIWYLVGTAESFKMYSRTAGMDLALTLSGSTQESTATMTATGTDLCLTLSGNGYAISHKDNTNQSFNMFGGAGSDIKLYTTTDGGSTWGVEKVAVDKPLTLAVKVNGTQPYANNTRVGHLTCTIDDVTTSSLIKSDVASQTYYLPVGATFTLNSTVYRGYVLDGFLDANGDAAAYEDATIPDGGLSLTASYSVDANNKYQYLAYSPDETHGKPYRIPAIATAQNGDVIAVYDYRPCGSDIGFGEVDIMFRRSTDNGATWTDEVCIADGQGGSSNVFNAGFGDAAFVADRESENLLVMCVAGKQVFTSGTADSHNFMGRIRSTDNGQTWKAPEDVTSIFLGSEGSPLFPNAYTMFFGSGRLLQSRVYKAEGANYYRVYGALLVNHPDNADGYTGWHNYVVYSDDFGDTWNILGGSVANGTCSNRGNEPKVEELPDGTIILSSRNAGGRIFNVFTYTDKATGAGTWSTDAASATVVDGSSQGTNGEIMKVKAVRNADGAVCDLMLQTVPKGPGGRKNVTVYYKEMEYNDDGSNKYDAAAIAADWSEGLCVSPTSVATGSAYSTMTLQADGNIGFFYEEEPAGYCLVYVPLSVSEMTNGAYSLYYDGAEAATLVAEANDALNYVGVGYPKTTAAKRIALQEAVAAVSVNASYEGVATLRSALAAYLVSTEEIQMPEDGKTYVIYNVLEGAESNTAATNNVLLYNEATGVLSVAQKSATDDDAEKFVCRVIDAANNLYAFVNAKNGKYVLYFSPKSTDAATPYAADEGGKATGFAASYNNMNNFYYENAEVNDLFIYSAAIKRFGTVSISCKADAIAYSGWVTMVVLDGELYMNTGRADGTNYGHGQQTLGGSQSACFAFQEVSYPNTVKLNTIDADDVCVHGLGEGKGLGTFSAPFATVLPEGVTAYYADSKAAGGVTLTELGTKAVPANQGVILVGNKGIASALMIPALTDGTEIAADATISGNQFSHTAGTTHALALGDFVLGNRVNKGDGTYEEYGAAFYQGTVGTTLGKNKTYVVLGENSSAAKACHLNFGGETTGIESVNVSGESTGAIYDLSGRRVTQLLKGGVYIRDGKKYIVK